ncbi:hypothetical protein [Bacillus sp. WL1]|uniref:hypothetical protein n=1 Tax=Bacillus sp. WL1 TaxID=2822693 RepID=UPI001FF0B770|nr:hypothetical protein [Bacillus sp. WL1]
MSFSIPCSKCGHLNTEDNIEQTGYTSCGASCGCEGYEYELICSNCGNVIYNGSQWGEFDKKEIAEDIVEELIPNVKSEKESTNKSTTLAFLGDSITIFSGTNDFSSINPKISDEIQRTIDKAIKKQEGITKNKVLANGKLSCNSITADRLTNVYGLKN